MAKVEPQLNDLNDFEKPAENSNLLIFEPDAVTPLSSKRAPGTTPKLNSNHKSGNKSQTYEKKSEKSDQKLSDFEKSSSKSQLSLPSNGEIINNANLNNTNDKTELSHLSALQMIE